MAIKQQIIQPIGMRQDDIINSSDKSGNFAVDVKNLRFNTIEDLTTGVWTTEQGNVNKELHIVDTIGSRERIELNTIIHHPQDTTIIGSTVINNIWVLFGIVKTDTFRKDFIIKVWYENDLLWVDLLYVGDLNFDSERPLETMPYFENEEIQKVYWTDNYNQPRVINIANVKTHYNLDDQFDFVRKVSLDENIYYWKENGQNGIWNAGSVKYAVTYFNKYGQESNIIWTSPLMYPTVGERGCDAEEVSGDMFHIVVNVKQPMIDSWDCIRLYSIYRSSEGATPLVKIVEDRQLINPMTGKPDYWYHFRDTNTTGLTVDSNRLMFVGGREMMCETFDQKDGVMFMGNLTLKKKSVEELLTNEDVGIYDWYVNAEVKYDGDTVTAVALDNDTVGFVVDNGDLHKDIDICKNPQSTYVGSDYIWNNQLNYKDQIGSNTDESFYIQRTPNIFKSREWYRFGIQFQDDRGNWSEVHHLRDCQNNIYPLTIDRTTRTGVFKYVLPSNISNILLNNGYLKARLVYCPPTNANRRILSQGLISPTISNDKWEKDHAPDCFHSYFYRHDNPGDYEILSYVSTRMLFSGLDQNYDTPFNIWHNPLALGLANSENATPLQLLNPIDTWHYNTTTETWWQDDTGHIGWLTSVFDKAKMNESKFRLCRKVVELSSPDVEFDDSTKTLDLTEVEFRKVGFISKAARTGYCYLDFMSQAMDYAGNKGKGKKLIGINKQFPNYGDPHDSNDASDYLTGFKSRSLLYWNDIDVYNANSIPKNEEDDDDDNNDKESRREQFDYLRYDYYIYPFHRKYLNNYMGDLDIQMYRKGKDPDYHVSESSIIKEKTFAYRQFGLNNNYQSDDAVVDIIRDDVQVFDAIGDATLRLKTTNGVQQFLYYMGNMNSIAPLCNYQDIWKYLYAKTNEYSSNENPIHFVSFPDNMLIHRFQVSEMRDTKYHITDAYYSVLSLLRNGQPWGFNAACEEDYIIQPTFTTPIFKYQGLNILAGDKMYVNVNTGVGDEWRRNWSWDDTAACISIIGAPAALVNNTIETRQNLNEQIDPDGNLFSVIQRSNVFIPKESWLDIGGRILIDIFFGNIFGIIQECINLAYLVNDACTAHTINVYKGAYPIPVIENNEINWRPKLGEYILNEPAYYTKSEEINNESFAKKLLVTDIETDEDDNETLNKSIDNILHYMQYRRFWPVGVSSDSVPFAYKTTPRFVLSLQEDYTPNCWALGEIYRDVQTGDEYANIPIQDKSFGNIEHSAYIPCSRTFSLLPDQDVVMYHDEGDYYFMRYDNLHTYPYTDPSINGIVEIMSYMVETRVNLDGRCDKNRGLQDNTIVRNNNFNIINKAYTQHDNYFTYFCIDELSRKLNKFKNSITWSKVKVDGDLIDTWTNVTLVNTADCDGTCGDIRSIKNVNNTLIVFQEHGIAQIGYNEKTAISTESNVPLEMINSGRFSGFNYITKDFGCQNKWSISNNQLGLMFIDDSRNELLAYNSNGADQISKKMGFESFMIQELKDADYSWNPKTFNNFITFYDKISKDLYFLNDRRCLAFNETSNSFTSFYDYNGIPAMANVGSHFLMWGGARGVNVITTTITLPAEDDMKEYLISSIRFNPKLENDTTYNLYDSGKYFGYSVMNGAMDIFSRIDPDTINNSIFVLPIWFNDDTINPVNFNYCVKFNFGNNDMMLIFLNYTATHNAGSWQITNFRAEVQVSGCLRGLIPAEGEETTLKLRVCGADRHEDSVYGIEHNVHYLIIGGIFEYDGTFHEAYRPPFDAPFWRYTPNDLLYFERNWSEEDAGIDGYNSCCVVEVYDFNLGTSQQIDGFSFSKINNEDPYTGYNWFYYYDERDNSIPFFKMKYLNRYAELTTHKGGNAVITEYKAPIPIILHDTESIESGIWATRENEEYSKFFNEYSPYWITLMSDGGGEYRIYDKVFNTIEYRADLFDKNTLVDSYGINAFLFTDIAAWNGYQFYKDFDILEKRNENAVYPFQRNLDDRYEWQSERKFNVWRTIIPRATYKDDEDNLYTSRDRIRNPFTFIKLTNYHPEFNRQPDGVSSHRMVLHNFTVNFDVR